MIDSNGVYFFHIPKTAGMSVYKAIDKAFEAEEICPFWLWDHLIDVPSEALARFKVFRGHFYGFLEPFLGRRLKKFALLREPIDRTISYYYYIRNLPEHPNYAHAQALTLREFCLHDATRYLVENYQAGYLASFVQTKDPRSIAQHFASEERARHLFQAALEPRPHHVHPNILLDAARDGLSRLCAVGIVEQLALSMERIGLAIGHTLQLPAERLNVTPRRVSADQLDTATLRTVQEITAIDHAIYRQVASSY